LCEFLEWDFPIAGDYYHNLRQLTLVDGEAGNDDEEGRTTGFEFEEFWDSFTLFLHLSLHLACWYIIRAKFDLSVRGQRLTRVELIVHLQKKSQVPKDYPDFGENGNGKLISANQTQKLTGGRRGFRQVFFLLMNNPCSACLPPVCI